MKTEEKLNMTMLCDFYELTMGNGYFQTGFKDRITYFDVYFRSVPDGGGFAIAAGLEQLIEYIEDLHFDEQDIAYLRGKGIFCEEFLEYLRTFRFTSFKEASRTEQALKEHAEIIRLVEKKDYEGAAHATSVHLRDAMRAYLKLWKQRKGRI